MRALEVEALGKAPRLVERSRPSLRPHQSLVEVRAAAVGHIDLQLAAGTFGIRPEPPFVPGSEGSGVVVESAALPLGTAVRIRGGGVGARRDGTWAECVAVPDSALVPLRGSPDWTLAASYFSPATTAWAAIHDVGSVASGERVVVTGAAGAVGLLAVQLALDAGAQVVGVVGTAAKRSHVPSPATAGCLDELDELLAGEPVDAVVDTVGGPVLGSVLRRVRPGGRAVLIGYTAGDTLPIGIQDLILADVSLLPVNLLRRASSLVERGHDLLERLQRGDLQLPVNTFPLDRHEEAFAAVRDRSTVGKVVLIP